MRTRVAMLAAVLALAPSASADVRSGSGKAGDHPSFPVTRDGLAARDGVVLGEVDALDYRSGTLSISSSGARVVLRGSPEQLGGYVPGDVAAFPFEFLGGARWLALPSNLSQDLAEPFARQGTAEGEVSAVDKAKGWVRVAGMPLRCHPRRLEGVLPGHYVQVAFVWIAGAAWALEVRPAEPARDPERERSD